MRYRSFFGGLLLSTIVISVVFAGTAAAVAATDYTFKGYGYGHGIGMCQWGAKGRADKGQTYDTILKHYFQGTQVTEGYKEPSTVRVRLFGSSNLTKTYLEPAGSSSLSFINTDATKIYEGAMGKWAIVPASDGTLKLVKPDGTVAAEGLASPIIATNATDVITVYNSSGGRHHAYKGSMYIYSTGSSSLYLVNLVQFDPVYLYGLGEVPSSWPYQALYSQAVAARSYAIANMKPQSNFDLYDSVASQVYVGVDKINETSGGTNWGARWKKAIDDTVGQVVTYGGTAISAYYFSSCGGHTENIEFAWPAASAKPYLVGVDDIDSTGKAYCQQSGNSGFSWSKTVTKADLESKLGVSNVAGLKVTKRGASPRISELDIIKSDGTRINMQGKDFRSKLGLKSTWIYQMGGVFPDVPLDYWAAAQIEDLVERGIIAGYTDGTFKPETPVTRGQFAKMLCLALGIPSGGSTTFTDMTGHWSQAYVAALVSRNIVGGYPDNSFRPDTGITRAEIAAISARALDLSTGSKPASFPDTGTHWAKYDIQLMASNGIVTGYTDGYFRPNASAKRSETSVIVYRMFAFMQ